MESFASLRTHEIGSFEALSNLVVGTSREVIQLERGTLKGCLWHASICGLPVDAVTFNLGLRTRGAAGRDRVSIGMLSASAGRVTRASYESRPGDVLVTPPGTEHENRYYGGSGIIVVSLSPDDLKSFFGSEFELGDMAAWRRSHFTGNAGTVQDVIPRLETLVASLSDVQLNAEAAEFWKRAVIEAITSNVVAAWPAEPDGPLPSALKVVRRVEEYLDAQTTDVVHISQICSQLHLSRRTLHRAFHEALGLGPIAFLRYRRLCAVHTTLRAADDVRTISDLAMQHGFQNLGRFSGYYHQLFGEYPSETRRQRAH